MATHGDSTLNDNNEDGAIVATGCSALTANSGTIIGDNDAVKDLEVTGAGAVTLAAKAIGPATATRITIDADNASTLLTVDSNATTDGQDVNLVVIGGAFLAVIITQLLAGTDMAITLVGAGDAIAITGSGGGVTITDVDVDAGATNLTYTLEDTGSTTIAITTIDIGVGNLDITATGGNITLPSSGTGIVGTKIGSAHV